MKTPIPSKKCLICGDVFFKKASHSKKAWEERTKFCSRKCSDSSKIGFIPWNKGRPMAPELHKKLVALGFGHKKGDPSPNKGKKHPHMCGEGNPKWRGKESRICLFCKKEIQLAPWEVKAKRKFCSLLCYGTWHRGANSPVFKGDKAVSKFRNRVMQFPEYNEWRNAILTRDDWRCQECGFRNEGKIRRKMEVDHIKRFLHIVQGNNLRTLEEARNCKELWDITNGRCLCRICHRKSDTYGTKGLKITK